MKSKRIGIFTERMLRGFGVDLVVHEQAELLAKEHEVSVFAINIDRSFTRNANYNIYQLNIPLRFNPILQDIFSLKKYRTYSHLFDNFDTFIIHTPTFNSWLPFLKRIGKTIVCFYGNSPSDDYPFPKRLRKPILDFSEHAVYFNNADKILSISGYLKSTLPYCLRTKTEVVHLGGDHILRYKRYFSKKKLSSFRNKYFITEKEKVFTYIGRLDYRNNPYKNTKFLFTINRHLKRLLGDSSRLIAIGYPEGNIEEELFREGISVIPLATNLELAMALYESTAYLSPSLWEGFNLPLIEAQILGTPVIAFKRCAHMEVVRHDKTGFLASNNGEFLQYLSYIINDSERRNQMSIEAREFASHFSWKKNVSILSKHL